MVYKIKIRPLVCCTVPTVSLLCARLSIDEGVGSAPVGGPRSHRSELALPGKLADEPDMHGLLHYGVYLLLVLRPALQSLVCFRDTWKEVGGNFLCRSHLSAVVINSGSFERVREGRGTSHIFTGLVLYLHRYSRLGQKWVVLITL